MARRRLLPAALVLVACLLTGHATAARPPKASTLADGCGDLPQHAATGSALKDAGGTWRFADGIQEGAAAHAAYVDSAHTPSNFGKLRVVTSPGHPDRDQLFGAGFVEGYLTAARIFDHHHNLHAYFVGTLQVDLEKPMKWIHKQDKWVRRQVAAAAAGEDLEGDGGCGGAEDGGCGKGGTAKRYWSAVGLALAQWDGLVAGYAARSAAEGGGGGVGALTREDLLFLHSNGDLYDVIDMYEAKAAAARGETTMPRSSRVGPKRFDEMSAGELWQALALQGKCSALVKVKEDLSDIFFGHSTWDNFMAMLRIFKHYEFNLSPAQGAAAPKLSFSSYPGELFSDDDLYMTSARLVVLETTNHVYNPDVFKVLTPHSVLSWQRVRTANLLAASGAEWVALFKQHNSGTYNNQYMITDLNKFSPGKFMAPGMFHVVEQLPGIVEAADMTAMLARGYWPSYNVAFFPRIYNESGYPDFTDGHEHRGTPYEQPTAWLKYQTAPRANIFRRDQSGASDLASFKAIMRYNNWQSDPLSGGAPFASVCGRGDLAPEGAEFGPVLKGCYDSKVTSYAQALRLEAEVVNGPTAQGQPPFEWSGRWANVEHRGMPDRFDFNFEVQSPADLPLTAGCRRT
ncbi:MAG: phospholipase B-like protein [Monoraphidium minutum]|nr:MAG: phospholipase B-like protein [Monoraphidium minutum]